VTTHRFGEIVVGFYGKHPDRWAEIGRGKRFPRFDFRSLVELQDLRDALEAIRRWLKKGELP
jgi:hypothetical protein